LQRPVHHLALRWIRVKTIVGTLALLKAGQSLMGIVKENKTKQTLRLSTQFSVRRGGERGGRGGGVKPYGLVGIGLLI